MKTILFVHHVSIIGGGSYCLLSLLKELDRKRYKPIVLLAKRGPLVYEIEKLNIEIYFLPQLSTVPYNKSLINISALLAYCRVCLSLGYMRKFLKKISPDILYLNNSMLYPYLKIAKKRGIKTLIHIREHWPLNEHIIQFKWFQNGIAKYSDQIIAINKYSQSMIPEVPDKISIVYDWIDFKERYKEYNFNELLSEDARDKKVFLFTGGFQSVKGALEVILSFSKICDNNSRLLILGGNLDVFFKGKRGKIVKALKWFGYKGYSVKISEALNRDKRIVCIPSTYAIKDIIEKSYCLLSYFTIPHANLALAESIILKTPVIAARTEESEEYTENGKYGFLFDFRDTEQFESYLRKIDLLIPQFEKYADEASLRLQDKFDRRINADKFRDILDRM